MNQRRTKLLRRIARLNATPSYREDTLRGDLEYFIDIIERVNEETGHPQDIPSLPHVTADYADAVASRCRLLDHLERVMPEITAGPIRRDAQYWTSCGGTNPVLEEKLLIGILDAHEIRPSTKPFYVGLFTSTGVLDTYGMWRIEIESYGSGFVSADPPGDPIYGRPWQTWHVVPRPDVRVLEIASAGDWVDFVTSHPLRHREMLYPDWRTVARSYDAVHMTLRALAAVQGVCFLTDLGLVAPTYWDLESTFWLRWCFDSVRLVETVE